MLKIITLAAYTFSTSYSFKKDFAELYFVFMRLKSLLMFDQELSNPGVKWFISTWYSASFTKISHSWF